MNEEIKAIFKSGLVVSFRCSTKLRTYFVRAKLCPLKRSVGSSKVTEHVVKYVQMLMRWTTSLALLIEKLIK